MEVFQNGGYIVTPTRATHSRRVHWRSEAAQVIGTFEPQFTNTTFFERLISVGHEVHLLRRQYRMNPEIARFVSQAFYNNRLINDPSTSDRADAAVFIAFATKWYNRAHSTLFVSVRNVPGRTQIYAEKESKSLVNPANATAVSVIIKAMLDEGIGSTRPMASSSPTSITRTKTRPPLTYDIMVIVYIHNRIRILLLQAYSC